MLRAEGTLGTVANRGVSLPSPGLLTLQLCEAPLGVGHLHTIAQRHSWKCTSGPTRELLKKNVLEGRTGLWSLNHNARKFLNILRCENQRCKETPKALESSEW
jgi:hypothetical protein